MSELADKMDPREVAAFEDWWAKNKDRYLGFKIACLAAWNARANIAKAAAPSRE